MAKFFVGQRVRVECEGSMMDGMETRIIALNVSAYEAAIGDYFGHEVEDAYPSGDPEDGAVFEEHELIPILSEHEPCESEFKESLDELMDRCREGVSA